VDKKIFFTLILKNLPDEDLERQILRVLSVRGTFQTFCSIPLFPGGSGTVKQSLSETKVKITRRVEKIAMAWFFIFNQQGRSNEDIVTSSKLTATNV